jgi:hypothetical protein
VKLSGIDAAKKTVTEANGQKQASVATDESAMIASLTSL